MSDNKKKKEFFLVRWFKRMFLGHDREVVDIMQEEQLQTPFKTMVKKFLKKKTVIFALTVFVLIFALVLIGPNYWVLDLSEQDSTLINLPPGYNMMNVPKEMDGKVADIAAGSTYGIGISTEGKIYTWGTTRITEKLNIADIPQEVRDAKLVKLAAGKDHAVALDEEGQLYVWGNTRLQQANFTSEMKKDQKDGWNVIQLEASTQFSAVVTDEGNLYLWGNGNQNDLRVNSKYQGKIAKVALTANHYVALLEDGTVVYAGNKGRDNPLAKLPKELENLLKKKKTTVVDITSNDNAVAALTADGQVFVWGIMTHGEDKIPQFQAPVKKIYGGRFHFTALLEDNTVVSWGENKYKQTEVPAELTRGDKVVKEIFVGNHQNYALPEDGKVITWGLKGFLLGTDDLGRDMLTRIVNGGAVTMTVGAISVVIATIIGVVMGGLAGYFGGKVDVVMQRIVEVIYSVPEVLVILLLSAMLGEAMKAYASSGGFGADLVSKMGANLISMFMAFGMLYWVGMSRIIRGQVLQVKQQEYVTAARALGASHARIIRRHLLPNCIGALVVTTCLQIPSAIFLESFLSYLGVGVSAPMTSLGSMAAEATQGMYTYPYRILFPAFVLSIMILSFNLLGDGLRDALDPRLKK